MLLIILVVILIALALTILARVINKHVADKNRKIVSLFLWIIILIFGFLTVKSILKPIQFEEDKKERFQLAVNKLLDLKKAQVGYKSLHGKYAASFDELIKFIESERFAIIQRKDTSVIDRARNAAFGLNVGADGVGGYFKDVVIIDTLGYIGVRDSLFKNSDSYKSLGMVKINNKLSVPVDMKTGEVDRKGIKLSTFQAIVDKNKILEGLDEDLIAAEKKKKEIDEITGDIIKLGSLEEVSTTGNWPKQYGNNE
jgi:hypothetical protein